ncbi:13015_t:CDS:2 [Funneliformis geosporum]|uniref:Protein PBN1 n=1 Tax=Funneliformis geosporum TaxID=1117311 RepID=A0A9W4SUP3_9GLOM|nr:15788_t:CDS:2 [Funneliformis geosporum]CAI2185262.1 13015_t:CDS:2 [Funneliformis geosporum]
MFRLFLLITLLVLVNKVESISRQRHTFFFENNAFDAFTKDTIQIFGNHSVRVDNFTGIRELKVKTTPEELVKSVIPLEFPAWSNNWTLRVQIASGTQALFHPFNTAPVPGIHIGISLDNKTFAERLDYKNADFLVVCKYIEALLGEILCNNEKSLNRMHIIDLSNSITLPGGNIYYYSSIPFYQTPSPSSILGRESYSKEHRRPIIIDLHLAFDKKTNQTKADLRMIWKYRNQDIKVNNQDNQEDIVELGVFGPPLDSDSFIGPRVVFGDNDNPKPTMLSVFSRTLVDSFFNSSISPSQSFHPHFNTLIKYSTIEDKCKDHIVYTLPNSFFVDIYQLKDMFSDEQIKVWGETDLESPVGMTSLKWGSLVLITKQNSEDVDNFEFNLPLHMRYQPAISGNKQKNHVITAAPWPFVIRVCENDVPEPLYAPTPLPLSLLFPSTSEIKYIFPQEELLQHNFWPKVVVGVPVGQLSYLKLVEWWTILTSLMGCVWIIWTIKKKVSQWKYEGDNNKID